MIAPEKNYLVDGPQIRVSDRLKHLYSDICLYITVLFSNRTHLLYPSQLSHYRMLRSKLSSVFHDYTPLSGLTAGGKENTSGPFVLLAGAPWYRKGADLAIQAFQRLAADYPHVKLRIVGHFPDGVPQKMASASPQVEVLSAVNHDEMMKMVGEALIVLLPSRNEGLPRILIEGMAAGRPVVGSDVGGIPFLIRDGENGLIFPAGDIAALELRLRELLSDEPMRRRMGQRGYELARATLTEQVYVDEFTDMIDKTVGKSA
jgi:glycosyltransferase involved in cell wall biosynthesis